MQAGIGLQEGGGAGEGRAATRCLPKVLWSFSPWKWAVVGEGARKEQRQPGVIETAASWLWGPQTTSSNSLLKGWPPSHSRGPPESGTHSTSSSGHISFKRKKEGGETTVEVCRCLRISPIWTAGLEGGGFGASRSPGPWLSEGHGWPAGPWPRLSGLSGPSRTAKWGAQVQQQVLATERSKWQHWVCLLFLVL